MESLINLDLLAENYPDLKYNDIKREITGHIYVEYICYDEFIKGDFEIKIKIFNNELPIVWEISNKISKNYQHMYNDRSLCLATDLEQRLYMKSHTIVEWIKEYVEKYFVSYIYYKRYGIFPFGEHSHGEKGIYEFIKSYYGMDNLNDAKNIYEYACTQKYRGHLACPCGSGKRIRNCHGKLILKLLNSDEIGILRDNYRRMQNVGRNK